MRQVSEVLRVGGPLPDDRSVRLSHRIDERATWSRGLMAGGDVWERWTDHERDADPLVEEVLALAVTGLFRASGVGADAFDVAEALAAEMSDRAGVPRLVLGLTSSLESMDRHRASVSLRFPGAGVWEAVFLAHEVGHHVVAQLRHSDPALGERRPLEQDATALAAALAATGTPAERSAPHSQEHLADMVATVACGPTFPLACACLRVPGPRVAEKSTRTHPSWSARIAAMRSVLDVMSEATGQARHRHQREHVLDPVVRELTGAVPDPRPATTDAALRAVRTIVKHRPGLVYADADPAIGVARALAEGRSDPPPDASVLAVLDGAWRWLLGQPDLAAAADRAPALVAGHVRAAARGGGKRSDAPRAPRSSPVAAP